MRNAAICSEEKQAHTEKDSQRGRLTTSAPSGRDVCSVYCPLPSIPGRGYITVTPELELC